MDKNQRWMLITYYCPTHGDLGRIEPLELTREEFKKNFIRNNRSKRLNH